MTELFKKDLKKNPSNAAIVRDWGVYLKRNLQYKKAGKYFKKSIEMDSQFRTLLESSECKLKRSDATEALNDIQKCLKIKPKDTKAKHQYAKCVAGLNQIEDGFFAAHEIAIEHPIIESVQNTTRALEIALRNSFCPSAEPVLRQYKLHLKRTDEYKEPKSCPVRVERQKAIELMKHKLYFDSSFAEQVNFWSKLQTDETLDDDVRQIIERITRNLSTHENMLYVREPFYAKRNRFDIGSLAKLRRRTFYYQQEEIRRHALWQFRNIKAMARTNFSSALALTERVLSEFYAVKRRCIFPAKLEFLCQLCNFIGTEYVHIYQVMPLNLMSLSQKDRLVALFDVYGTMLTGEELCDKRSNYFIERLDHADYDMEKAYLCHQLSEVCFRFRRPEESQRYARDALIHARECKNNTWMFLCYYNIIRVDANKHNYTDIPKNLTEMRDITANLDSFARVFVNTAIRSFEDIKNTTI